MPRSREDLFRRLAELGIAVTTVEHDAVFTVAESTQLHRELPGGHSKNLFLKDKKGRLYLVVALSSTQVDLKKVGKSVGASDRLSFGKAELLVEVLGVQPGSVTPFSLINDTERRVTVVLDADMMKHERLNFHPLENTATTNIARDDLVRFVKACGHEPLVLSISASSS